MIFLYNSRILYEEKKILYSVLPNLFVLKFISKSKRKEAISK